jgi:hypothetical protein
MLDAAFGRGYRRGMLIPKLTRRRLAGCALVAIAALAGGAWWLASLDRPGRLTQANFDRIRVGENAHYQTAADGTESLWPGDGMSLAEVSATIGAPFNSTRPWIGGGRGTSYQTYVYNAFDAEAFVTFCNGRATDKEYHPLNLSLGQKAQRVWYWFFQRKTIPVPNNSPSSS